MDDTRWLDDDEQRAWRAYLRATRLLSDALEAQLQRDSGLPHAYYEILVRLSEAPGRELRMSDLAGSTQSSRSRVSHAVARLEERGWVERRSCPSDRRGHYAVLTEIGFAALVEAAPGHVDAVRTSLFDPLTAADVATLETLMLQIAERLDDAILPVDGPCSAADDTAP